MSHSGNMRDLLRALQRFGTTLRQRLLPPVLDPGAMPFFSLTYISFLGMPFVFGPEDGADGLATMVAVAVFVPLYFAFYWARDWHRAAILLVIAALAVPMLSFNWFSSTFLIYSNVLAVLLPWRQMLVVVVVSQLLWMLAVAMTSLPFGFFVFMGAFTGVFSAVGCWVWVSGARRNAALRLSQDEVRRLAVVAERERIGRDLHDLLGHTLSVVALKSELAGKLIDRDAEAARREIIEVGQVAREALAQVRSAVTGFRRMLLPAALANARMALDAVRVEFRYETRHGPLPQEIETILALALREAVTNVARHARAHHCSAVVEVVDDRVRLIVEDDGVGAVAAEGHGLSGMRERVETLGGSVTIDSGKAHGTRLLVEMPLEEADEQPAEAPLPLSGEFKPA